jgi:hypothetical protein
MVEDTQSEVRVASRSAGTRTRRLARVGLAVGLASTLAFTGACRRSSGGKVNPELQAYVKTYNEATGDMAEAAGGVGKTIQESCKQALAALNANESKLTNTPDDKLDELAKGFVEERREAYTKCAETGESPAASKKTVEMESRLREMNQ